MQKASFPDKISGIYPIGNLQRSQNRRTCRVGEQRWNSNLAGRPIGRIYGCTGHGEFYSNHHYYGSTGTGVV